MSCARPPSDSSRTRDGVFPGLTELAVIAGFWLLYGTLNVINGIFPPGGQGVRLGIAPILGWGLEALLWMVATPCLFWLTSRFRFEGRGRLSRAAFYAIVGLAIAFAIDLVAELARSNYPMQPVGPRTPRFNDPSTRPLFSLIRGRYLGQCMIAIAVIVAGVARDYVTRYQRRLEEAASLRSELAEARLGMLRSQLNPHFLYNTLNAISALVDLDPRGVRRMIARLSELLRSTLEPSDDPEVPLGRELANLERYLEILRIRFQGRLETSIDVSDSLGDSLVPPMILQPLVENAMKHAVSTSTGASRIDVVARRRDGTLALVVRDTGTEARPVAAPAATSANGTGLGLTNTRARLRAIYGDEYSLTLTSTALGTDATIELPYHTTADLRAIPAVAERDS